MADTSLEASDVQEEEVEMVDLEEQRRQERDRMMDMVNNMSLVRNLLSNDEYLDPLPQFMIEEKDDFVRIVYAHLISQGDQSINGGWSIDDLKTAVKTSLGYDDNKHVDAFVKKAFRVQNFEAFIKSDEGGLVAKVGEEGRVQPKLIYDWSKRMYEDAVASVKNKDAKEQKKLDKIAGDIENPDNIEEFYRGTNRVRKAFVKASEVYEGRDTAFTEIDGMDGSGKRNLLAINYNYFATEYENLWGAKLTDKECRKICARSTLMKGIEKGPDCFKNTVAMESITLTLPKGTFIAIKTGSKEFSEETIAAAVAACHAKNSERATMKLRSERHNEKQYSKGAQKESVPAEESEMARRVRENRLALENAGKTTIASAPAAGAATAVAAAPSTGVYRRDSSSVWEENGRQGVSNGFHNGMRSKKQEELVDDDSDDDDSEKAGEDQPKYSDEEYEDDREKEVKKQSSMRGEEIQLPPVAQKAPSTVESTTDESTSSGAKSGEKRKQEDWAREEPLPPPSHEEKRIPPKQRRPSKAVQYSDEEEDDDNECGDAAAAPTAARGGEWRERGSLQQLQQPAVSIAPPPAAERKKEEEEEANLERVQAHNQNPSVENGGARARATNGLNSRNRWDEIEEEPPVAIEKQQQQRPAAAAFFSEPAPGSLFTPREIPLEAYGMQHVQQPLSGQQDFSHPPPLNEQYSSAAPPMQTMQQQPQYDYETNGEMLQQPNGAMQQDNYYYDAAPNGEMQQANGFMQQPQQPQYNISYQTNSNGPQQSQRQDMAPMQQQQVQYDQYVSINAPSQQSQLQQSGAPMPHQQNWQQQYDPYGAPIYTNGYPQQQQQQQPVQPLQNGQSQGVSPQTAMYSPNPSPSPIVNGHIGHPWPQNQQPPPQVQHSQYGYAPQSSVASASHESGMYQRPPQQQPMQPLYGQQQYQSYPPAQQPLQSPHPQQQPYYGPPQPSSLPPPHSLHPSPAPSPAPNGQYYPPQRSYYAPPLPQHYQQPYGTQPPQQQPQPHYHRPSDGGYQQERYAPPPPRDEYRSGPPREAAYRQTYRGYEGGELSPQRYRGYEGGALPSHPEQQYQGRHPMDRPPRDEGGYSRPQPYRPQQSAFAGPSHSHSHSAPRRELNREFERDERRPVLPSWCEEGDEERRRLDRSHQSGGGGVFGRGGGGRSGGGGGGPQAASTPLNRSVQENLWQTKLAEINTPKRRLRWHVVMTLKGLRERNRAARSDNEFQLMHVDTLFELVTRSCANEMTLLKAIGENGDFHGFLQEMEGEGLVKLYHKRRQQTSRGTGTFHYYVTDPMTEPPAHFRLETL